MLAFFSQRRAVLRPFSCNTVIGSDSTAKLRQSAGLPARARWQIRHAGTEFANDCKEIGDERRGARGQRQAGSTGPPSCDPSPIAACTTEARAESRTRRRPSWPPSTRATASSATCRRPRTARRWSSTTTTARSPARRRRDGSPRTARRASHVCATGATTRTFSRLPSFWTGRRPRAAAGRGQGQRPRPAAELPRQDRAPGQSLQRARSRSCPSTPTSSPSSAGWRRPCRAGWWSAATSSAELVGGAERGQQEPRILDAPAGLGSGRACLLRHRRAHAAQRAGLDDPHAPELALFSWTIRTARERRAAARWADAPIFEGYEA